MRSGIVCHTVRLSEKSVQKVETYPNPGKHECHSKPDFASNVQFSFRFQVVAECNTEEDDCYGDEHDSERWGAMHGYSDASVITYLFTSTQGSVFAEILGHALQKETGRGATSPILLQRQPAGADSRF